MRVGSKDSFEGFEVSRKFRPPYFPVFRHSDEFLHRRGVSEDTGFFVGRLVEEFDGTGSVPLSEEVFLDGSAESPSSVVAFDAGLCRLVSLEHLRHGRFSQFHGQVGIDHVCDIAESVFVRQVTYGAEFVVSGIGRIGIVGPFERVLREFSVGLEGFVQSSFSRFGVSLEESLEEVWVSFSSLFEPLYGVFFRPERLAGFSGVEL